MSKVAAIQMCSTTSLEENLNTAASLIAKAAQNGAVLAVLPEMFAIFGEDNLVKIKLQEPAGSGKIQDFLADLAHKHQIWIVGGTIPLTSELPHKVRAACLVFNEEGKQVARYDKIHLFDVALSAEETYQESATTEPGKDISVIQTPFGKLGLCVCYDLRFPELFSKLSAAGAEIIAVPAAFTVKTGKAHWKLLARARAIDTFSYLIGACQAGLHANGRQTYGHSLIVNPWGEVIRERRPATPGIVYGQIDLKKLAAIRQQIPLLCTRY